MKSNAVLFWLAVLFVFSGAMVVLLMVRMLQQPQDPGSIGVPDPEGSAALSEDPVTEFTLTERSGLDFSSSELEGQVWVASFFFSRCPASCTQQNLKVQELQREFGSQGVRFVSISSDPVYDTPSVLSDYARRFNADPQKWLFLTGDFDYIERVAKDMFHAPIKDAKGGPTHFDLFYAIDRAGQMHYFNWKEPEEFAQLKTALGEFLAASPEEARAAQEQNEVPSADTEATETEETDLEESDVDSADAAPDEDDEQPAAEADDSAASVRHRLPAA